MPSATKLVCLLLMASPLPMLASWLRESLVSLHQSDLSRLISNPCRQRAREAGQTVAAPVATMAGSYGAAQWGQHGQAAPKVEHAPPPVHQKAPVQHAPPPAHTPVEQKAPVAVMHTPTVQHTPTAAAPVHTPPAPVHTSSSVAHTSSTVAPVATHAPPPAAPLPSHGSGSAPWNNEYNDCVQRSCSMS